VPVASLACVDEFREKAKAPNTRRAYHSDWEHFLRWCGTRGRAALPSTPDTVAWYLAENAAKLKVATLQRRLAAISRVHQAAGVPSPTSRSHAVVRETWKGIRRAQGVAQTAKSPLLPADLRKIAAVLPPGLAGTRDRALLLLGFAGALRRSELVGLDLEDLDFRTARTHCFIGP
jgi:integrase